MRTFESPYVSDWFAITLRWLTILGLTVSLTRGDQLMLPRNLFLVVLIAWNLILTFIAVLNRRLNFHRQINLVIDLAAAGVIFWLQGGLSGPAFWVGILPILSASIYFELKGALLAGLLMAILQVVFTVT